MPHLLQRTVSRLRRMTQGHIRHRRLYLPYVVDRKGLEIGGPSEVFRKGQPVDIYSSVGRLDNCDFSRSTVWAEQQDTYRFDQQKAPGKSIFCDGSELITVADDTYDFVLSSHNLEHFANPVKALKEAGDSFLRCADPCVSLSQKNLRPSSRTDQRRSYAPGFRAKCRRRRPHAPFRNSGETRPQHGSCRRCSGRISGTVPE